MSSASQVAALAKKIQELTPGTAAHSRACARRRIMVRMAENRANQEHAQEMMTEYHNLVLLLDKQFRGLSKNLANIGLLERNEQKELAQEQAVGQ